MERPFTVFLSGDQMYLNSLENGEIRFLPSTDKDTSGL